MSEEYTTVEDTGTASFDRKGSEFIGYIRSAKKADDAEKFLKEVHKDHPDATHHVSAYCVRSDPLCERYDDDGEPSGSAGKPVLNVLQGEGIENVVAVVVRYYGGTKLGYGGLVSAYSDATKKALKDAGTKKAVPHEVVHIEVGYDDSGTVHGIIESEGVEFEADYGESVVFVARPPEESVDELADRVLSATSGRARIRR